MLARMLDLGQDLAQCATCGRVRGVSPLSAVMMAQPCIRALRRMRTKAVERRNVAPDLTALGGRERLCELHTGRRLAPFVVGEFFHERATPFPDDGS